ncbi:hypothetical protein PV762_07230 [Mitsuaria sp. CC2]|uniref:hypothetical protein n=1 Tax=Mitsuaria sp. CC2 TaxID=3029186 RepID=UPI003B8D8AB1
MAEEKSEYMKALAKACNEPDDWDRGGLALGGVSEIWKRYGELLAKWKAGRLGAVDVSGLRQLANYLDDALSSVVDRISKIPIEAVTPEEKAIKRYYLNLAEQAKLTARTFAATVDADLAGRASKLFANGSYVLAGVQVFMAYYFDGVDEGAKKLFGAVAGYVGGAVGAGAGYWAGTAIGVVLVELGVAVSAMKIFAKACSELDDWDWEGMVKYPEMLLESNQ